MRAVCVCAGVCRVVDICRLKHFVSIDVLMLILLTWNPHISVWYGIWINTTSLVYIQLFPFFHYVLNAITPDCSFSSPHPALWKLLWDYTAQDVLQQCPTIFLNDFTFTHPIQRGVLECIDCLSLFTQAMLEMFPPQNREKISPADARWGLHRPRWNQMSSTITLKCASLLILPLNTQVATELGCMLWRDRKLCFFWVKFLQDQTACLK